MSLRLMAPCKPSPHAASSGRPTRSAGPPCRSCRGVGLLSRAIGRPVLPCVAAVLLAAVACAQKTDTIGAFARTLCQAAMRGLPAELIGAEPTNVGKVRATIHFRPGFPGPQVDLNQWPLTAPAARCTLRPVGAGLGTPPIRCTARLFALPGGERIFYGANTIPGVRSGPAAPTAESWPLRAVHT